MGSRNLSYDFFDISVSKEILREVYLRLRDPASGGRGEFTQPRKNLFGVILYVILFIQICTLIRRRGLCETVAPFFRAAGIA